MSLLADLPSASSTAFNAASTRRRKLVLKPRAATRSVPATSASAAAATSTPQPSSITRKVEDKAKEVLLLMGKDPDVKQNLTIQSDKIQILVNGEPRGVKRGAGEI